MINFLLILVGLAAGYLLRKFGKATPISAAGVNAWILYVALPAVTLKYVPTIRWNLDAIFPLVSPWIVLAGAAVFLVVGKSFLGSDRKERAALLVTSGLGNTSFVGFPLVLALYGSASLSIAVLCDQITFALVATVGVLVTAGATSQGKGAGKKVLFRLLTFPSFLAFIAALVLPHFVDLGPVRPLLDALGATLAPLALFSVGLNLSFSKARRGGIKLGAALFYKLFIAPALVLGLAFLFGIHGATARISVFEASMAPMITAGVLASEYGAAPDLAGAMVGIGIPLSLLTALGWWYVLGIV